MGGLSHRVLHGLSTQEMQVDVHDFLMAVCAGIHYQAVAILGDTQLFRQAGDDGEHPPGIGFIGLGEGVVVRNVFVGDDEHMHWGGWVDVLEGSDQVVFIDFAAGNIPLQDFTEDAVSFAHSLLLFRALFY